MDKYLKSLNPANAQDHGAAYDLQEANNMAFASAFDRTCSPPILGQYARVADFSPGEYDFFLSARYNSCTPAGCPDPIRYLAEETSIQVGIGQFYVILFAIIGGLLAYPVVTVRGNDGPIRQLMVLVTSAGGRQGIRNLFTARAAVLTLKIVRDLAGVAILSAAFTIVCSRLSTTNFPIKISVPDAWGAMTIGFLSYFAGNKFIDSLHDLVAGKS